MKIYKKSLLSFLIYHFLFCFYCLSFDFHDFDKYQEQFTKQEIEQKIKIFLEKDAEIQNFYQITADCLLIGDFAHHSIDYCLHLSTFSKQEQVPKNYYKSLQGIKIAIDPGHFGGELAHLEDRQIKVQIASDTGIKNIVFDEGTLTYHTAFLLREMLEAEGACVFITRKGIGKGAIKESFFEWLLVQPVSQWNREDSLGKIFRDYYNKKDLQTRAQVINAFAPHLTVIIHYNGHLSSEEKKQNKYLTASNYNLAFIPGAFCANELKTPEDRYEFLRLLVTDDVEQSLIFSQIAVNEFAKILQVPIVADDEKNSYMQTVCMRQLPGVYSRNLSLTRCVHGPLCYGETLIQNNEEECIRLSAHDMEIEGMPSSARVKQVAQAYFISIKKYLIHNE